MPTFISDTRRHCAKRVVTIQEMRCSAPERPSVMEVALSGTGLFCAGPLSGSVEDAASTSSTVLIQVGLLLRRLHPGDQAPELSSGTCHSTAVKRALRNVLKTPQLYASTSLNIEETLKSPSCKSDYRLVKAKHEMLSSHLGSRWIRMSTLTTHLQCIKMGGENRLESVCGWA